MRPAASRVPRSAGRLCALLLALLLAAGGVAQEKKRIERAADLPRFSYRVGSDLEKLVRDDAAFGGLARALRRDFESVLVEYEIADKATLRQLLAVLAQLDYLEGRLDDALAREARIRELQEKPADRLLSGLQLRAMAGASKSAEPAGSDVWQREVSRRIRDELEAMPFLLVHNGVKRSKASLELLGEANALGRVREVLQPIVAGSGALSSELVGTLVGARYAMRVQLPLKATLVATYRDYLAAHAVAKPDIWAARDVTLDRDPAYAAVVIAIWDSGVDPTVFPGRMVSDAADRPAVIAFDRHGMPSSGTLLALPDALRERLASMEARTKGMSDVQANIDSREATEVREFLSTLRPDQYRTAYEELRTAGVRNHGTHVAGIAIAGNPYARLLIGRIEFQQTLRPDPCPSQELVERSARNQQAFVDHFRAHGARVVNASWGESVGAIERELELCSIGRTVEERKAMARGYFERERDALARAIASAPEVLFVASAGNSNQDASFVESIPSGLRLPNLISVGAVDQGGDEAAFTSYGPTVTVHANGYQVESYLPGGKRVALSGTSMSAPQVTNLAAKMLAVNPRLTPPELIAIIRETAERSEDGRRQLIHPANAVKAAMSLRDGGVDPILRGANRTSAAQGPEAGRTSR